MNYVKEEITELDTERIRSDINAAKSLYELASMDVKRLTADKWAIDRSANSYLCRALVIIPESATSGIYAFFYDGRLYELVVTGMFGRFSVEVTMNEASLNWQDANLQLSLKTAFLKLGLPFQAAADVFTEELGITFDNAATVFEFLPKKTGT